MTTCLDCSIFAEGMFDIEAEGRERGVGLDQKRPMTRDNVWVTLETKKARPLAEGCKGWGKKGKAGRAS
jgi:hypothetical protein